MEKGIPVYQAKVGEADETGIFAMSFVDYPANESNFVALKSAQIKLNLNKPKQILTGCVLIPNQKIYRNDAQMGEYYLTFTAADIEKIAQKMMKQGAALSTTTHQHEGDLKGNYLTEVWIVQNSKIDKSVALGLGEFPVGTLMASYKVNDAKYWREEVVTGKVKGFSLEGFFNFNSIKMSKPKTPAKAAQNGGKVTAFLKSIAAMLEGDSTAEAEAIVTIAETDETDSGEPVIIFELAAGGEIWVDADGFATIDSEQAPAGEHALADGNVIVIDDAGNLVVTQEEAAGAEPAASEAALAAAKAKGKEFLAAQKKPATGANAAEIAKLKRKIAELEKTPTAEKVKPVVLGGQEGAKKTFNQTIAAALQSKAQRKYGK